MTDSIRLVLADDHPLVRAGIRAILAAEPDLILVGEAADGDEAQRLGLQLQPDVLLLDLNMPGQLAADIVARLQKERPSVRVIALTAYDDDTYVRNLVEAGVAGYVLKEEATDVVVQAVRKVARGGAWYSPGIMVQLAAIARGDQPGAGLLGNRDLAVLRLVVEGKTNQEIATNLAISEKTVEKHLTDIFTKLGVTSRVAAAVRSVREHWV